MSEEQFTTSVRHAQQARFVEYLAALAFAMLLVSIVVLFEAKTLFFQRHFAPTTFTATYPAPPQLSLNEKSYKQLVDFASEHSDLAAVGLVAVDLSENARTTLVMIYNDKELEGKVDRSLPATTPMFTSNVRSNTEMSSLLNGEFGCYSAAHSTLANTR